MESATRAPSVVNAVDHRFGAPVVEASGLTEASHQVASNPLPPLDKVSKSRRFPGERLVEENSYDVDRKDSS